MGIKQYIFFTIIFLVLTGVIAYTYEGGSYTIGIFSHNITLPIAIWLLVPATALFIASTFHLIFYYIKAFLSKRVIKKDYETLLADIKNNLLDEDKTLEYKTPWFGNISKILKKLNYNPNSDKEVVEPIFLNETFEMLSKIYSGEYVDLKKLRLRGDNPISIANKANIINSNDSKAILEVLKQSSESDNELYKKAFNKFVQLSTFGEIKKVGLTLNGENIIVLFRKFANDPSFIIPNEDVKDILENITFTQDEYLECAKLLKTKIDPSGLLTIFENIQATKSEASVAYLYLLFELQMIDKIREVLDNSDNKEYIKFKILLFLRDNGKNVSSDLLI